LASGKVSRRAFLIGGALAGIAYLYFQVKSIAVTKYDVPVRDLPASFQGFTILHLSDLHSKEYGAGQERLLDLIKRYEFDMVAITGDLVDKDNQQTHPAISLIRGLPQKPVFFVPGNHEWWSNYAIKASLLAEEVQILENANYKYSRGDEHIWIAGVDDPFLQKDNLDQALEGTGDAAPRLLLAHAPDIYPSAMQAGIDLIMVGHTHGGQVRLPLLGAIYVPGKGLFPQFDYGMFFSGLSTLVINGGLGESTLPLRFNNRPEIVLITLYNHI
jgi:uncharacterized protein